MIIRLRGQRAAPVRKRMFSGTHPTDTDTTRIDDRNVECEAVRFFNTFVRKRMLVTAGIPGCPQPHRGRAIGGVKQLRTFVRTRFLRGAARVVLRET